MNFEVLLGLFENSNFANMHSSILGRLKALGLSVGSSLSSQARRAPVSIAHVATGKSMTSLSTKSPYDHPENVSKQLKSIPRRKISLTKRMGLVSIFAFLSCIAKAQSIELDLLTGVDLTSSTVNSVSNLKIDELVRIDNIGDPM